MLLKVYTASAIGVAWLLRGRHRRARSSDLRGLVVLALATQHLARLIAKDSVTAPLRAPFTRFVEASGEGEVNEEVIGTGLRHAIGELLTCPFCISQWVATALVVGTIGAPELTESFATACALARASDYLQLAYDLLKPDA